MSNFLRNQFKIGNKSALNPFKSKEKIEPAKLVASVENEATTAKKLTYRQRLVAYVKLVANDYKDVGKDSLIYMKTNPVRASVYLSTLGSFVYFYKKNPDMLNYTNTRRVYLNELILCGSVVNKKSEYYLNSLQKLENCHMLEYRSYVFFSLIFARHFSEEDVTYEKRCAQLNNSSKWNIFNQANRLVRFLSGIVDVGFLNNWYFLNKHFNDYDVDEDEWVNK